ncbi:MAG: sodium/pantothenate symporter [Anaerovoracaceae bacterium]|jgi:sodium/pantothenate symporter
MSKAGIIILAILIIYMAVNLIIGVVYSKMEAKALAGKGFISNYFIGGRSLGGVILAMTLAATYASASSFIGGPGLAYTKGLAWVFLSSIQVPTSFIVLGILGKKFALISRRTNAVTVTDYLRTRYESKAVVIISSVALVLFFVAQMISQFIGGAILIQTITGLPYKPGLILFALVVIVYTSLGGFKAVAINDTIQGFIMVVGCFLILYTVIHVGGGYHNMLHSLDAANPVWDDLKSDGSVPMAFIMSFWVLVGVGVIGLPQTAVRCMGFKDTRSMHKAMVYGTIVVSILMIIMVLVGVFSAAIVPRDDLTNTDYLIPAIVLKYMNPVIAGLFLAAPLSAIMSTVAALLLLASAAILKDIYLNYIAKDKHTDGRGSAIFEKKIGKLSTTTTFLLGVLVVVLSINPPDLIVWVNLFAMGGLECAFVCPIVFGLYWKKANATGAIASTIISVTAYLIMKATGFTIFGVDAIVPGIAISVIAFVIGSLLGKKPRQEVIDLYY